MEAIRNTDEVVKNITELIEATFNDSLTAYIFTSDHGMTDWGRCIHYRCFLKSVFKARISFCRQPCLFFSFVLLNVIID